MPFRIINSRIVFQGLIDKVTQPHRSFKVAYMDELLLHSASFDEHCIHISAVLTALTKAEMYVKPSKCRFAQKLVKCFGFIMSDSGLKPDPKMVQLHIFLAPTTLVYLFRREWCAVFNL
jgi:hypothetical protein